MYEGSLGGWRLRIAMAILPLITLYICWITYRVFGYNELILMKGSPSPPLLLAILALAILLPMTLVLRKFAQRKLAHESVAIRLMVAEVTVIGLALALGAFGQWRLLA